MNKKRVRSYPWTLLALAVLAIVVLVGGVAGAYSTHLAPDVPYLACPTNMKCYVFDDGTLVEEVDPR